QFGKTRVLNTHAPTCPIVVSYPNRGRTPPRRPTRSGHYVLLRPLLYRQRPCYWGRRFAADNCQNVYRCSSDFCMLRELLACRSAGWPVRPCQTQTGSCRALSPFPFSPILLFFPLHRRCIRVLHFKPVGGAAGTIGRVLPLRDDAFEAKLAGMREDGRAVPLDMLIESNAGAGLGHDRCERGLANL